MKVLEFFSAAFFLTIFLAWGVALYDGDWYAQSIKAEYAYKTQREVQKTERQKIAADNFTKNLPIFGMLGLVVFGGGIVGAFVYQNNKSNARLVQQLLDLQQTPQYQPNTRLPEYSSYRSVDDGVTKVRPELLLALQKDSNKYAIVPTGNSYYRVQNKQTNEEKVVFCPDGQKLLESQYEWS